MVTATNRGDLAATLVHRCARRRVGGAVRGRAGALPRRGRGAACRGYPGRLALVLDRSASMRGYGEREWARCRRRCAARRWNWCCAERCDGGWRRRCPTPRAGTDLASGRRLRRWVERPDLIAVVTRRVREHVPGRPGPGRGHAAAGSGVDVPVVCCLAAFGHSDDLTLRRPAPARAGSGRSGTRPTSARWCCGCWCRRARPRETGAWLTAALRDRLAALEHWWRVSRRDEFDMTSLATIDLAGFRLGAPQRAGALTMVPVFGPSYPGIAPPRDGVKLSKVDGYGTVVLRNPGSDGVAIVPLHIGYMQDGAQNHALCRSAFLAPGQELRFEDACCVQESAGRLPRPSGTSGSSRCRSSCGRRRWNCAAQSNYTQALAGDPRAEPPARAAGPGSPGARCWPRKRPVLTQYRAGWSWSAEPARRAVLPRRRSWPGWRSRPTRRTSPTCGRRWSASPTGRGLARADRSRPRRAVRGVSTVDDSGRARGRRRGAQPSEVAGWLADASDWEPGVMEEERYLDLRLSTVVGGDGRGPGRHRRPPAGVRLALQPGVRRAIGLTGRAGGPMMVEAGNCTGPDGWTPRFQIWE